MDSMLESRPLLGPQESGPIEGKSEQDSYLDKVKNRKLYLATFAAVLGPLSFGFVLGYTSPAIPELRRINNPRLQLDAEEASWFGSVVTVGAAFGGVLGGWVVDKIGRKLSLMFCSLPFIFGFTIIIAAQNVWMLYLGRVLTGLASGMTSLAAPLYISETAHERVRGTLGSCVQLMVVTGILGSYVAGLVVDWRWLAVTCSVPPTAMLLFMCFMPETPRFLLSRGKRREAEAALHFLRGPEAPAEWECAQIEGATQEQGSRLQLSDLKDPGIYKPLLVGVLMMLFQQLTGINAIMFYAETIFEDAHFKNSDVASVVVGAFQVIFTALAAVVMDRAGRKVLLIVSDEAKRNEAVKSLSPWVAMAISTAVFGVYFRLSGPNPSNSSDFNPPLVSDGPQTDLSWLALTSMGVFITGFAIGWGPIPWLVMSEIFPTPVRGLASSVCVLTNWSAAFVVTKTFQDLTNLLSNAGTFWLFSAFCTLNIVFTIFCVPETKGKTLEEIQARFKGTA